MSKQVDMVLEPLRCVLKDVTAWEPGLQQQLDSDFNAIEKICITRGTLRTVMIDFPKALKHFDKSLSSGVLVRDDFPHTLVRERMPLFASLISNVFDVRDAWNADTPWLLSHDPCVTSVFFIRCLFGLYKKVDLQCSPEYRRAAVEEFKAIDSSLRQPTLSWNLGPECFSFSMDCNRSVSFLDLIHEGLTSTTVEDGLVKVLDQVVRRISSEVPFLEPYDLKPRHGPGAVADLKGKADKYAFPAWGRKNEYFLPAETFSHYSEEAFLLSSKLDASELLPAKLSAVRKTYDKPRLISIEPTANQFLQQSLKAWIRENLPNSLRLCIDFRSQVPSRDAALEASRTGKMATIDLSSASDRLSCWSVERFLHSYGGILPYLYATRSSTIVDGTKSNVFDSITLLKFAGQGSAVTFPVQSIAYAMLAITAVLYARGNCVSKRNISAAARSIRVFGDDIIIENRAVPFLGVLLQLLQLKVNIGKSHYSGHFRESCGMDAFMGEDVTPLYLRSLSLGKGPKAITSHLDVCNNAHAKGLWNLADWLLRQLSDKLRRLIPVSRDPLGCLTLQTFCDGVFHNAKIRYDADIQQNGIFGLVPTTVSQKEQREGYGELFAYFCEYKPREESFLFEENVGITYSSGFTVQDFFNLKKKWVVLP